MAVEVWDCHRPSEYAGAGAVLISTTSYTTIGPILCRHGDADKAGYDSAEQMLEAFLVWVAKDPRAYTFKELAVEWQEFINHRETRNDPQF